MRKRNASTIAKVVGGKVLDFGGDYFVAVGFTARNPFSMLTITADGWAVHDGGVAVSESSKTFFSIGRIIGIVGPDRAQFESMAQGGVLRISAPGSRHTLTIDKDGWSLFGPSGTIVRGGSL